MPKKKIEIPVTEDVGLHMEFLEGDAEEPKETVVAPLDIVYSDNAVITTILPDCALCLYGPCERRAMEECDIALRRGNALHCTKFVRKL